MTEEKVMAAGNPLNEELKQEILSIDGVTDIIPSRQSLHATYKTEIHQAGGMCDMLTDQNYAAVEAALTEGTMPTDSRSIVIDYNVLKPIIPAGEIFLTIANIIGASYIHVPVIGLSDGIIDELYLQNKNNQPA